MPRSICVNVFDRMRSLDDSRYGRSQLKRQSVRFSAAAEMLKLKEPMFIDAISGATLSAGASR